MNDEELGEMLREFLRLQKENNERYERQRKEHDDLRALVMTLIEGKAAPGKAKMEASPDLPPLADMQNVELTLFDNGKKQGRARYVLKFEIKTSEDIDYLRRDFELSVELYDSIAFGASYRKKAISDEYKNQLRDVLYEIARKGIDENMLIGMIGRRGGGKSGYVWAENQYVLLCHDGAFGNLVARLHIEDETIDIDGFDNKKHPVTGKAFANAKIVAKAIWEREEGDGVEEGAAA